MLPGHSTGRNKALRPAVYLGTPEHASATLIAYAMARHSAIDLADGAELLATDFVTQCDSGDTEPWDGAAAHPNEDRRRPVF